MIKKSLIRIACLLFSLTIITSCALYLSSNPPEINNNSVQLKETQTQDEENNLQNTNEGLINIDDIEQVPLSAGRENNNLQPYKKKNVNNTSHDITNIKNEDNIDFQTSSQEIAGNISSIFDEPSTQNNEFSSKESSSRINMSSDETSFPTSSKSSSSVSPSSSKPEIVDPNEEITTETINALVNSLTSTYDINIIIARTSQDYNSLLISNYAKENIQINNTLLATSRFLSLFPKGFIKSLNIHKIVLCGKHLSDNPVTIEINNNESILLLDCSRNVLPSNMLNKIANIMGKVVENSFKNIEAYNPEDFIYSFNRPQYVYSSKNSINCYFLNASCQQSKTDDILETIKFIFTNPDTLIKLPKQSKLVPKIIASCSAIKSNYPVLVESKAILYFTK